MQVPLLRMPHHLKEDPKGIYCCTMATARLRTHHLLVTSLSRRRSFRFIASDKPSPMGAWVRRGCKASREPMYIPVGAGGGAAWSASQLQLQYAGAHRRGAGKSRGAAVGRLHMVKACWAFLCTWPCDASIPFAEAPTWQGKLEADCFAQRTSAHSRAYSGLHDSHVGGMLLLWPQIHAALGRSQECLFNSRMGGI